MKRMIIITDNIYFQCAEVKSVNLSSNQVQVGWKVLENGHQEPRFGRQYFVNIMYEISQEEIQKQRMHPGQCLQIHIALDSKKEAKNELRAVLKQVQKQRKDDVALIEAFEEHFGDK